MTLERDKLYLGSQPDWYKIPDYVKKKAIISVYRANNKGQNLKLSDLGFPYWGNSSMHKYQEILRKSFLGNAVKQSMLVIKHDNWYSLSFVINESML